MNEVLFLFVHLFVVFSRAQKAFKASGFKINVCAFCPGKRHGDDFVLPYHVDCFLFFSESRP